MSDLPDLSAAIANVRRSVVGKVSSVETVCDAAERSVRLAARVEVLEMALREVVLAGDVIWKALLTVKPALEVAYPDDERWSPWTRWLDRRDEFGAFCKSISVGRAALGSSVALPEGTET